MGLGIKIFKTHHPNQFGVNYAKLEINQVKFQKILELCQRIWLGEIVKNGSQRETYNSQTVTPV